MTDKNGLELKIGQIVKIENGYFKADNGIFRVQHAPGNENWMGKYYSLKKINSKTLADSEIKYNLNSWPLAPMVNSREKSIAAKEYNAKFATIEIIGFVTMYKIKITSNYFGNERTEIKYVTGTEFEEEKKEERWNTQVEILEVLEKSAELSHK